MKKLINGLFALSLVVLVGCAASGPAPGVGVWGVEMVTPFGALPATLTLNADGSGSFAAEALGEPSAISGIVYDANMVTFTGELDAQGQTIVLEFSGTVDGDSLVGEFGSDFGAFEVTGSRQ